MPEIKNTFIGGKMNKDLDERIIRNGEYRDAMNVQVSTSEDSDVGTVQNILGNQKVLGQDIIPENSYCVGSISDEQNDDLYWFIQGSSQDLSSTDIFDAIGENGSLLHKDLILKYNVVDNFIKSVFIDVYTIQTYIGEGAGTSPIVNYLDINSSISENILPGMTVVYVDKANGLEVNTFGSAKVESVSGGIVNLTGNVNVSSLPTGYLEFYNEKVLNFDKSKLITGINIVDDLLLWTDNFSEPKKINIKRSIEGTDVEHRPNQDGNKHTNLIVDDRDLSNSTNITPIQLEHITVIKKYPLTPPVLDLLATEDLPSGILVNNFYHSQTGNVLEVGTILDIDFGTAPLKPNDILILSDRGATTGIPYEHEVRLRVIEPLVDLGPDGVNILTGFWRVEILSISSTVSSGLIDWDWMVSVSEDEKVFERRFPRFAYRYKYEDGEYSTFSPFSEIAFVPGLFEYESKKAYNLGLQNTLIKVKIKDFVTPQIPDEVVQIDILYKETNSPSVYVVDKLKKTDPKLNSGQNAWELNEYEIDSDIIYSVLPENQLLRSWDNVPRLALAQEITGNRIVYGNYLQNYDLTSKPIISTNWLAKQSSNDWTNRVGEPSVKSNRQYNLGITYLDSYGRETPVFTSEDASFKIPFEKSASENAITISNKSIPPSWAEYWKVYVKETSSEYYNLVMDRVYRAKDGNVWLSFPSSDRNKVDEETFLMLKKGVDTKDPITKSNRYKIIAIENEAPDFIKTKRMEVGESSGNSNTPIVNDSGVQIPAGELFPEQDYLPGRDKFKIRIHKITWEDYENGFSLDDETGKLSLTFFIIGSAGNTIYSQDYDIATYTVLSTQAAGNVYDIVLEKPIEEYWLEANANGSWSQAWNSNTSAFINPASSSAPLNNILAPTLGVKIHKYEIENKPEFDGRFFAKIYSDGLIEDEIASLINASTGETIIAQAQAYYLADKDVFGGVDASGAVLVTSQIAGTTGNAQSNTSGEWHDNLDFNANGSTESEWFIDEAHYKATVTGNDGIFIPESKGQNKGVWEDNGQWYIDLSFSKVGPRLHDGDIEYNDFISSWSSDDPGTHFQKVYYGSNHSKYFGVGISANPNHSDQSEFVNRLIKDSRFRFSGDPTNTVYTITDNPDINYHLNHTTGAGWWATYSAAVALGSNLSPNDQEYEDLEYFMKKLGAPGNRRTTFRIPIDKNPNDYWNPTGTANNGTATVIEFIGTYMTGTVNQLQSADPAIWETEPKENVDIDIYYEASQAYPLNITSENNTQYIPIGSTFTYNFVDYEVTSFDGRVITFDFVDKISNPTLPNTGILYNDTITFNSTYTGSVSVTSLNPGGFFGNTLTIAKYVANQPVTLGWYNCYSFGNGVESDRIRDDFNQPTIDNGAVASTILEEPYKEERRKHGLIYSGLYNSISGINNLNQFIQAEKITKDLNPVNGSIQKLHSRDTDLITLCEDKVLRILSDKDAVYEADGNTQLTSTNRVLGQAVPFVGEYGISKNPESFASESYRAYFTDKQRGVVMRLSKDGLTPISNHGMKDWFRDNLKLSNKLIGSYDDRNDEYNITLSYIDKTVSFKEDMRGWVSFKSFIPENAISCANDYFTMLDGNLYKHYVEDTTRNTFYDKYTNSSIDVVLNQSPQSVKSFHTLGYEGSQSQVVPLLFYTTSSGDILENEYYNLNEKDGWYVDNFITDKEKGSLNEFIEKEGKWFNYLRGESIVADEDGQVISGYDTDSFAVQGIGFPDSVEVDTPTPTTPTPAQAIPGLTPLPTTPAPSATPTPTLTPIPTPAAPLSTCCDLTVTPPGPLSGDNITTPYLNTLPTISLGPASSCPNFGDSSLISIQAVVTIQDQYGNYATNGNDVWYNKNVSIPYLGGNLTDQINNTPIEIYPFTQDTSFVNPNDSNLTSAITTNWDINVMYVFIAMGGVTFDPCDKIETLTIVKGCMDNTSVNYDPNANWHNSRMCISTGTTTF